MEVNRKNKLLFGLLAVALILLAKLFYIQVIDSEYKKDASNNSMVYSVIYPPRGVIYDRNGEILVGNSVCYDILVTPRDVKQLDTIALAAALDTSVQFIREKMQYYHKYRSRISYQTQTLLKQVSMETYVKFAEQEYLFPGFKAQVRSIRECRLHQEAPRVQVRRLCRENRTRSRDGRGAARGKRLPHIPARLAQPRPVPVCRGR